MYFISGAKYSTLKRKHDIYGGLFIEITNVPEEIGKKISRTIYKLQKDFVEGVFDGVKDNVMFNVNVLNEAVYMTLERLHGLNIDRYKFEITKIKEVLDQIYLLLRNECPKANILIDCGGNKEGMSIAREIFTE